MALSSLNKPKKSKVKKPPTRRKVLCECSICRNICYVAQGERQRHLKRDQDARVRRIQQEALASVSSTPSSTPNCTARGQPMEVDPASPELPCSTLTDMDDGPSSAFEDAPDAPLPEWPADTAGTPPPPSQYPSTQTEPDEFVVPDGWEDADPADEDDIRSPPPAIPPSSTPATTPSQDITVNTSATSLPPPIRPRPIAWGVPLTKSQENTPDPFELAVAPSSSKADEPTAGLGLLYLLVAWLHVQFRLPFRACSALVKIVILIIKSYSVPIADDPLSTLTRIMDKIDVEPTIHLLPICPTCLEVYPAKDSTPAVCRRCNSNIFKSKSSEEAEANTDKRVPLLCFPYKSILSSLTEIVAAPGVEEELDKWRKVERRPGRYTDIFDGAVARSLQCPDGSLFFRNDPGDDKGPDGVLRIGVTLGVDWFSYHRSQIAPSYTSCPMSFNIANLPPHLRYRTANLILTGIMPGPKEQNPDECQRFLRIFVNELIRLWHGAVIVTPSCPQGRRVEVILICVCCDKPAAHKMGGFASHSHRFFCTRCWIQQRQKAEPESFKQGGAHINLPAAQCCHLQQTGFPARNDLQHRYLGEAYAGKTSQNARDAHVKEFATRWSELARLPYFDIVRCIVIDPMHNLLLGLVKTHFYHIWVQEKILRPTKELRLLHQVLKEFTMPTYLGRIPALVGIPAGGSLTADQWMLMATVVGPIAVPRIWDEFMGDPEVAREQRAARIQTKLDKRKKAAEAKVGSYNPFVATILSNSHDTLNLH
ncbi:hypothetical protein NMY22_g10588 [Coprinellus aureogranulatus]|nr:hypothetical protein NMY22_g10588 [Coprinellus aureogranulatus]